MIRLITSALSNKDIVNAPKLGLPVVFLGGSCVNNDWRKEIEKEFEGDLTMLDPFNKNYDPEKDTHRELAGMVNSDYIIFYKGGEQTSREKKFLDLIGRRRNLVKEFDNMDSLKKFLRKLKGVNLESISSKIKKCATALVKIAAPFVDLENSSGGPTDFHFEKLDVESILKVARDLFDGKTIMAPVFSGGSISYKPIDLNSLNFHDPEKKEELGFLKFYLDKNFVRRNYSKYQNSVLFYYDDVSHKYEKIKEKILDNVQGKTAKDGVKYEYSCTMVDLPDDLTKSIISWGEKNVSDKDLYIEDGIAKGRENVIHVTVLYGIKSDNPAETAAVIGKKDPFEVRLGLVNVFKDNDKYDVLKIEVEAGELEKLHYILKEEIDNESTFPTYNPHVTIAYIKKGSMDHIIGHEEFKGKTFKVTDIVFSDGKDKDNSDTELPLGI